MEFDDFRKEYHAVSLDEGSLPDHPMDLARVWMREAGQSNLMEPNAMSLATSGDDGSPHNRMVLCKQLGKESLRFFTSRESAKSQELETRAVAAVTFYWAPLYRQLRIEGKVERVDQVEAEEAFAKRPFGAQIAARVSHQSHTLSSREELQATFALEESLWQGKNVACPSSWCGWDLFPTRIEFWQGMPNRLHERLLYREEKGSWKRSWLAP